MIKKSLLVVMTILSLQQLNAQTEKGRYLVGVDSRMSFSNTRFGDNESTNTLGFTINGAYFIIDNLAVGLGLGYRWIEQFTVTTQGISITPQVRYFIDRFFLGARYGYSRGRTRTPDQTFTGNFNFMAFQAGYAIFLNEHIAIEPSFNYFLDGEPIGNEQSFSFRVGFTIYLP